jgi:pSer/pThr/pTyr-binding forkhead associated (FHA) protein
MESPLALGTQSPEELEEHRAAQQRGDPFLVFRDGDGRQQIVVLDGRGGPVTVGRRSEADLSLPWDAEVSRLHAELSFRAGEWTISDDGWSQNGTWVNGLRLTGRRRLADGDLIAVGRTTIAYCNPRPLNSGATMVPGEPSAAPRFSDQQQRILRALCAPLLGDGDGVLPASDREVADATGIPVEVVSTELDLLGRMFGLDDMPRLDRRAEIAMLAVRSGLVG